MPAAGAMNSIMTSVFQWRKPLSRKHTFSISYDLGSGLFRRVAEVREAPGASAVI